MKRFVLAVGMLAMAYGMSSPARADFAVARFNDGYCRVWADSAQKPVLGKFLWWRHHHRPYYRFKTWAIADKHMHWAVGHHRCSQGL
jgi:hypothetical protein